MQKYQQVISQLKTSLDEQLWNQLLHELEVQGKNISVLESKNQNQNSLWTFIRNESLKPRQGWFLRLNQIIRLGYERRKQFLKLLYKLLPVLMQRYIQINHIKYDGLEECLITIYNFQYKSFNDVQEDKTQLSNDVSIRGLYQMHLGRQMVQPNIKPLEPIRQINNSSRTNMKSLIFYLMYREASFFNDQSLTDYYKSLFVYCGADEKDIINTGSLYLLEKTNRVSIFRYSISQDQLEWIILTLYQLCSQVKKDKFQLLAVIYLIHKKVSNQSLFRLSDVANSLIHLLEDQYQEIFT